MAFIEVCIVGLSVIVIIYIIFKFILKSTQLPLIRTNQYWGPGEYCSDDEQIIPFKINFSNKVFIL